MKMTLRVNAWWLPCWAAAVLSACGDDGNTVASSRSTGGEGDASSTGGTVAQAGASGGASSGGTAAGESGGTGDDSAGTAGGGRGGTAGDGSGGTAGSGLEGTAGGDSGATAGVDSGGTAGSDSGGSGGTAGGDSGGSGGVTGAAGGPTGGTGTQGGASGSGPTCEALPCCVPLRVDEERSQVYLVGSRIYYDIFVLVTDPDLTASDWGFDVELDSDATGSVTCPFDYTAPNTETSYYNACSSAALTSPACDQPLPIRVRLRSHTLNDGTPVCTGVGTGPEIAISPTLQCEECPPNSPSSYMGAPCNYPREANCYFSVSTPDGTGAAQCTCGLPDAFYQDPRSWSCDMP